jgi:hypothetical protein
MFALPAVAEPRNAMNPRASLVMVAMPAVLVSLKLVNPRLVLLMVALPAVLELKKVVTAEKKLALLVMTAFPAVLLLVNDSVAMGVTKKFGAFEEVLTMPEPAMVKAVELLMANE